MRRDRHRSRGTQIGPQSGKRSAYTLVEMLLVLAVIGTLAALTWPSVLRMQADHDLSAAAEQVRLQLATARTKAIKSGEKHQFLYEPQGRTFAVIPLEPQLQSSPNGASLSAGQSAPANPHASRQNSAGQLSEKISFQPVVANATSVPVSHPVAATMFQGLDNAGTLASVSWAEPLVFAPDGSAMDAVVAIGDKRGQRIDLKLRGLTGAASVSPMRQETAR